MTKELRSIIEKLILSPLLEDQLLGFTLLNENSYCLLTELLIIFRECGREMYTPDPLYHTLSGIRLEHNRKHYQCFIMKDNITAVSGPNIAIVKSDWWKPIPSIYKVYTI